MSKRTRSHEPNPKASEEYFAEDASLSRNWSKAAAGRQKSSITGRVVCQKDSESPPDGLRAGERAREGKMSGASLKIDSRGI
jgi:hypothetical protein